MKKKTLQPNQKILKVLRESHKIAEKLKLTPQKIVKDCRKIRHEIYQEEYGEEL